MECVSQRNYMQLALDRPWQLWLKRDRRSQFSSGSHVWDLWSHWFLYRIATVRLSQLGPIPVCRLWTLVCQRLQLWSQMSNATDFLRSAMHGLLYCYKKDGYRLQNVRQRQKLISIIDYDVCMTFYYFAIVTIAPSCTICELFDVE